MSSRALILARVRRHEPPAVALPDLPLAPSTEASHAAATPEAAAARLVAFGAALERMGGALVEAPPGASIDAWLATRFPEARVVCSATPEVIGTRSIESVREPGELDDVDVAVVRAAFGVAETGSVWLSEAELGLNALGFIAQHLVVLLDPRSIVGDLHEAYRHGGFREARYAVLMTGPSATADIEGVLVRGAQGVRSLTVVAAVCDAVSPSRLRRRTA